jgi:hypothetical protein
MLTKKVSKSFRIKYSKKYAAKFFQQNPIFKASSGKISKFTTFQNSPSRFSQNGHFKNVLFSKTNPTFFLWLRDIQKLS